MDAGRLPNRALRYPDALVFEGAGGGTSQKIFDVSATFEVLSPSTARDDKVTKLLEYSAVPTILHYAIVETERVEVLSYARPDGASEWLTTLKNPDDQLDLPAIGVHVGLAEIYADIVTGPSLPA